LLINIVENEIFALCPALLQVIHYGVDMKKNEDYLKNILKKKKTRTYYCSSFLYTGSTKSPLVLLLLACLK
jgi:hypothetical protein